MYYTKAKHPKKKLERTAPTDCVDRSGYIALDVQYARLMKAGTDLETVRDFEYNVDLARLHEAIKNGEVDVNEFQNRLFKNRFIEKSELADLLDNKLKKAKEQKKSNAEYKRLYDEFNQSLKEKQIRQDAVNEYKRMLEEKNEKK